MKRQVVKLCRRFKLVGKDGYFLGERLSRANFHRLEWPAYIGLTQILFMDFALKNYPLKPANKLCRQLVY
jgi:hypothetical protein